MRDAANAAHGARFLLCGETMSVDSSSRRRTPSDAATPDAVLDGLRRVERRIAALGDDGRLLAELIANVGERLVLAAAHADAATRDGDPQAEALRRLVADAAAAARSLAADALHALDRTATILDAQADTLRPGPMTAQRH